MGTFVQLDRSEADRFPIVGGEKISLHADNGLAGIMFAMRSEPVGPHGPDSGDVA